MDLTRDFCESPKSGTSDIGDYQSLVLRFVKITMLLNHGNVGDRPNSLKKSPRAPWQSWHDGYRGLDKRVRGCPKIQRVPQHRRKTTFIMPAFVG